MKVSFNLDSNTFDLSKFRLFVTASISFISVSQVCKNWESF